MKAVVHPIFRSPAVKVFDFQCQEEPHSRSNIEPATHHEITFTRTGDFEIHRGRTSFVIHNQVLLLTNPGTELVFRHRASVRDTCTTVRVSAGLLADVSGRGPDFPDATLVSTPAIEYLHAQLYRIAKEPFVSGNTLKTDDLFIRLIAQIFNAFYGPRETLDLSDRLLDQHLVTIERAKGYILSNFDQEISLSDISRAALVSDFHFSRIFRAFTNISPYSYLIQVRLNHAARLLKDTARSVTEICYDSGFNNFPHFVSTFTRRFGASPSRYKG